RIITQPVSQTGCSNGSATFTVAATGTLPLNYQWRFNATAISAATNSSYTVSPVLPGNTGNYTVVINNVFGTTTSASASLALATNTAATGPASQTVCPGATASFTTTASGSGPFSYRWIKNGVNIPGAASSSLV